MLCVKQPFFIKTRFLKTVVHIGREYKIIFFGYEPVQRIVHGPWGIFITVDLEIPAPVRPVLFQSGISIKAAGIPVSYTHLIAGFACFYMLWERVGPVLPDLSGQPLIAALLGLSLIHISLPGRSSIQKP